MSKYCPDHGSELAGGPVKYACPHGCSVQATDATTTPGRLRL